MKTAVAMIKAKNGTSSSKLAMVVTLLHYYFSLSLDENRENDVIRYKYIVYFCTVYIIISILTTDFISSVTSTSIIIFCAACEKECTGYIGTESITMQSRA